MTISAKDRPAVLQIANREFNSPYRYQRIRAPKVVYLGKQWVGSLAMHPTWRGSNPSYAHHFRD